ncbi:hypothetical protein RFY16_00995, partial [Acinetobacter baumannii]|nr:hypothetical protein [Acinetobacter baumannii]
GDYPILGFAILLLVLGWIYRPRKVDVSYKFNKPPRKTQQMMEKYARWILSHRRIVLTVVMLLTLALAYL